MSIYLIIFTLGLIFGSFAGAVVTRLKNGRDFVLARSACDECGHVLSVADLIPLLSWLKLRGRCRYCQKKISLYNPAVELVTATLFVISGWRWDVAMDYAWLLLALWLMIVVCMVIIGAYDVAYFQVPMAVAYIMLGLAIAYYVVNSLSEVQSVVEAAWNLPLQLLAATSLVVVPWAVSRGKWMGSGDIYLAALAGLVLSSPLLSLAAVLSSYYIGTLVVGPLMVAGKLTRRSKVPFGPFILSSIFLFTLFEPELDQIIRQFLVW